MNRKCPTCESIYEEYCIRCKLKEIWEYVKLHEPSPVSDTLFIPVKLWKVLSAIKHEWYCGQCGKWYSTYAICMDIDYEDIEGRKYSCSCPFCESYYEDVQTRWINKENL